MRNPLAHLNPKQRRRVLIGAGAGAVAIALVIRHRGAGATTTQNVQPGDLGSSSSGVPSGLEGGGGGGAPATADFGGVAPDLSGITDQLAGFQQQLDELAGQIPADPGLPPDPGPEPATVAPVAAAPAKKGFWWGGKWITSSAQLLAFERAHGNPAFNLQLWAFNHPGAAAGIGLSAPAHAPSSSVTHTPGPAQAKPRSSVPARPAPHSSSTPVRKAAPAVGVQPHPIRAAPSIKRAPSATPGLRTRTYAL